MLSPYVEAVLRDAHLADAIAEAWDEGLIESDLAAWMWFLVATGARQSARFLGSTKRR